MKPISEHPVYLGEFQNDRIDATVPNLLATIERLNLRIRSLETKCAELDRRQLENEVRTNLVRERVRDLEGSK